MRKLKETDLSALQIPLFNNDNLHLIAIANLDNPRRRLERWWAKKYGPRKTFEDHVEEELIIEMLEDFYDQNPGEAEKFLSGINGDVDWDGSMPDEYEEKVVGQLQRFYERNRVDLRKYQSDQELTPEEEEEILANLGRPLAAKSPMKSEISSPKETGEVRSIVDDEFDEDFGG